MAKSTDKQLEEINSKLDSVNGTVVKIDKEQAVQKAAFDSHTQQDEKMYDELKSYNSILRENTESLKVHVHRTNLLEDVVKAMDSRLAPIEIDRIQKAAVQEWVMGKAKMIGKITAALLGLDAVWKWVVPWLAHMLK